MSKLWSRLRLPFLMVPALVLAAASAHAQSTPMRVTRLIEPGKDGCTLPMNAAQSVLASVSVIAEGPLDEQPVAFVQGRPAPPLVPGLPVPRLVSKPVPMNGFDVSLSVIPGPTLRFPIRFITCVENPGRNKAAIMATIVQTIDIN